MIQAHGVTNAIILDELPSDLAKNVGALSPNLTTGTIDRWIEDAAGTFNSILESKGIDQDNLSENATRVIRVGIINYVVSNCLAKGNYSQESIDSVRLRFRESFEEVKNFPEVLGDDHPSTASIKTNIDMSTDTTSTFGSTFKF